MKKIAPLFFLLIIGAGCKKPYNPPVVSTNAGYLVVEGVIKSSSDSTTIKLSHTVNVTNKTTVNPVLHATVAVESDQGTSYPLTETTNGNYVSPGLNLNNTHTYRLKIKTQDNKQYQSDLAPVNITPPIDSVGFNIVTVPDTGIQIYVNTHDPSNNVKYYRWDYDEAWAFHSYFFSYYVSNGTELVVRTLAQNINECFASDVSSDIVLGSSAKLQQDVLYQSPIAFISSTSEKLETEYSILLRQYAITPNAYNFWTSLKKNTEQLGSIFDAQPSQIESNIHCITNPSEPVIGYVSVSTVTSKRIIISNSVLPGWVRIYPYNCLDFNPKFDTVHAGSYNYYNNLVHDTVTLLPTGPPPPPGGGLPGTILYAHRYCVDCTIRGTTTKPPFFK